MSHENVVNRSPKLAIQRQLPMLRAGHFRCKSRHFPWLGQATIELALVLALGACSVTTPPPAPPPALPEGGESADVPSTLTYVDQGWNNEQRDDFYYAAQGSEVMPYSWFLALEQVDGKDLFSDRKHLEGFGWIYGENSGQNRDGLPIGFTQNPPATPTAESPNVLGFTCSGCHTNDVIAGGRRVRIDGAPSLVDFGGFVHALGAAISANSAPDKWERFSQRVLGTNAEPQRVAALRAKYDEFGAEFAGTVALLISPELAGAGRFDALTEIVNALSVLDLGVPENVRPLSAPVSFPQLWLVTELDWVQWMPIASNPIARNTGEVLGVFGKANLRARDKAYQSTVLFDNLHALESWLSELKAPRWDEALFGAIDQELGRKGAQLFQADCRSCHNMPPYDRTDPAKNIAKHDFIEITPVPTSEVGTDPVYSTTFLERNVRVTEPLADLLFDDATLVPAVKFFFDSVTAVTQKGLEKVPAAKRLEYADYRYYPPVGGAAPEPYGPHEPSRPNGNLNTLKAGPLLGIWATGPFLHNGSVPSVYELLSPPSERPKVFWVGSRVLDTKYLGFRSSEASKHFRFDTGLRGNGNQGHSYPARGYNPDERLAVLEFLKDPLRFLPTEGGIAP